MIKSDYNKPLEKFKNIHSGESAIIFATGPSINEYIPFEGSEECIKVGLNRIYVHEDISSDLDYYYFGSHYYVDETHKKNVDKICLRPTIPGDYNFTKFASAYENGVSHGEINRGNISPEDAIKIGAIPFENNLEYFTNDVANYSTLGHSIIFPPLQHILYMGVKIIYLVGCDGGRTDPADFLEYGDPHLIEWWTKFKEFKDEYYKNVKIISINPVSLKGWFQDAVVE
jgi:hypothetical protein